MGNVGIPVRQICVAYQRGVSERRKEGNAPPPVIPVVFDGALLQEAYLLGWTWESDRQARKAAARK